MTNSQIWAALSVAAVFAYAAVKFVVPESAFSIAPSGLCGAFAGAAIVASWRNS